MKGQKKNAVLMRQANSDKEGSHIGNRNLSLAQ